MFSVEKVPGSNPECPFSNLTVMCPLNGFYFFSGPLISPFWGEQILLEQTAPIKGMGRASEWGSPILGLYRNKGVHVYSTHCGLRYSAGLCLASKVSHGGSEHLPGTHSTLWREGSSTSLLCRRSTKFQGLCDLFGAPQMMRIKSQISKQTCTPSPAPWQALEAHCLDCVFCSSAKM